MYTDTPISALLDVFQGGWNNIGTYGTISEHMEQYRNTAEPSARVMSPTRQSPEFFWWSGGLIALLSNSHTEKIPKTSECSRCSMFFKSEMGPGTYGGTSPPSPLPKFEKGSVSGTF